MEYNPPEQADQQSSEPSVKPEEVAPAEPEAVAAPLDTPSTIDPLADEPIPAAPPAAPPALAQVPEEKPAESVETDLDAFFGDSSPAADPPVEPAHSDQPAADAGSLFGDLLAGDPAESVPVEEPVEEPAAALPVPPAQSVAEVEPEPPAEPQTTPEDSFADLFASDPPSPVAAEAAKTLPSEPAETDSLPDWSPDRPATPSDEPNEADSADDGQAWLDLLDESSPEPEQAPAGEGAPAVDPPEVVEPTPAEPSEEPVPVAEDLAQPEMLPRPPVLPTEAAEAQRPAAKRPAAKRPTLNVKNTRHLAWMLGTQLGLNVMRDDQQDPWQEQAIAEMLGVELPPVAWTGKPADKAARVLKAASRCGEQLAVKFDVEHAALLELAVKSAALAKLYATQPELAQAAEQVIRTAAVRTELSPPLYAPLVEQLARRAPAEQVEQAVLKLHSQAESALREPSEPAGALW